MLNVGVLLFDNVELMDFAGPCEVFSVTSELNDYELFDTFTISNDIDIIKTIHGLKLEPDYVFDDHPKIDILVVPGGYGTRQAMENKELMHWLKKVSISSKHTLTVCTGSILLGKTGMLDGKTCVTHHEDLEELQKTAPTAKVLDDQRFIDNGKIITSGGIMAGVDASLYLVEKLHGKEVADKTRAYMEYGDWKS